MTIVTTLPHRISSLISPLYQRWHLGRWLAGLMALLLFCAVTSWTFLPSLVKRVAAEQTMQQIGRKLEIAEAHFSPFTLTLTLDGVSLYEADQRTPAFKVKQLVLNLSLASLFRQALIVDEVRVDTPYAHIIRTSGDGYGHYNFNDILDKIAAMPKSDTPFRFSLANLQINNGLIEFDDEVVDRHVNIDALKLGVPFLSNFPNQVNSFVEPLLSARINGSTLTLKGRAKPFTSTLDTSLAIDLEQLDLASYVPYVPVPLPVQIQSAKLSTKLDLIFSRKNTTPELILAGDLRLQDIGLQDTKKTPLLKLASLDLSLKKLNVMSLMAEMNHLTLSAPEVWLNINSQGKLNWASLMAPDTNAGAAGVKGSVSTAKNTSSKTVPEKKNTGVSLLPLVQLHQFTLEKGQIHLSDAAHAVPLQTINLSNIHLTASGLTTKTDARAAAVKLAMTGEHEEQIEFTGEVKPLSVAVDGQFSISHLPLAPYQPLINKYLAANMAGQLDVSTQVHLAQSQLALDEAKLTLGQFQVKGKAGDDAGIGFKSLVVDQLRLDLSERNIRIGNVQLDGLNGDIRRDSQAVLSIKKWLPAETAVTSGTRQNTAPPAVAASDAAWKLAFANIDVKNSAVTFSDQSVEPAFRIQADGIALHLEQLQSDLSQAMKFSLQSNLGRKSSVKMNGNSSAQLKKIDMNLDAEGLPLAALYPYFSQYVNVALTRGRANAKAKINLLNITEDNRQISYNGMLSLTDFHVLENGASEDFLEWKSIALDGINANIGSKQPLITIKKLSLNDFYARAILSEKGKLNLQNILVSRTQNKDVQANTNAGGASGDITKETAKVVVDSASVATTTVAKLQQSVDNSKAMIRPEATAPIIRVMQTTLRGGNINFTDNFIKPNYSANLTGLSGNIGAVASDNPQPATVELTGKVDDDAPLVISGAVNPLLSPIFLDIKGSANGLELTRLTPYAAKYAGYIIEKGKLSMQVAYRVENQQLKAENEVRLDQLTFGERVDSPAATKLPVMLAVALLRDNDGQIAINLPISGSLSDPQFSVGNIIFRVLINVITKAVTAPFSLLGSMFGGGEELAYAEFLPGQSVLTPAAKDKLDHLAIALKKRSGLKLDIIGRVDAANDTEGSKQMILEQRLRDLKWKDARQKDRSTKKEEVQLSADDRKKYIEELYQSEKMDKPRNLIGIAKTLPTAEAEQMLLAHTMITPDALRGLAQKRADVVRDYLEDVSGIERDRLFLIAPKLTADGIKDKGATTRVDFSLK
ncbi:DUF748 domain-containing protein [Undibacterium sp. SXout7W]|uniref:DUF748 domain-containing protein n=1 Tax=Undibacterium sp. SXout7W TaxID=3413049 RepID=UPI003BF44552